eukprot:1847848-Pyramimonas_sp.AAC.1
MMVVHQLAGHARFARAQQGVCHAVLCARAAGAPARTRSVAHVSLLPPNSKHPPHESGLDTDMRLVRRENIPPAYPASDWSVVRMYPRFLRMIGPSCEYTRASCV